MILTGHRICAASWRATATRNRHRLSPELLNRRAAHHPRSKAVAFRSDLRSPEVATPPWVAHGDGSSVMSPSRMIPDKSTITATLRRRWVFLIAMLRRPFRFRKVCLHPFAWRRDPRITIPAGPAWSARPWNGSPHKPSEHAEPLAQQPFGHQQQQQQ